MKLECIKFPNPYQYATVKAGEKKRVWYLPISGGYVGFIEKRAMNWFSNTHYDWTIDGVTEKVEHQVDVIDPEEFLPPIVAKRKIEWWAYNDDSSDHVFEVLMDGRLCKVAK